MPSSTPRKPTLELTCIPNVPGRALDLDIDLGGRVAVALGDHDFGAEALHSAARGARLRSDPSDARARHYPRHVARITSLLISTDTITESDIDKHSRILKSNSLHKSEKAGWRLRRWNAFLATGIIQQHGQR